VDHRAETAIGLVVSRCDAAELFEITEEVLDEMPPGIHGEVAIDLAFPVCFGRDDCGGASLIQFSSQPIIVEGFVPKQGRESDLSDQGRYANAIVAMTRQKDEAGEVAERVHKCNDFRGQAAPRPADGLIASPPFAPVPCW
jgi:hypothetical protein